MTELSNLIFIIQMCAQLAQMSELHPSEKFRCNQTVVHTVQYHFDGDFNRFERYLAESTIKDFPIQQKEKIMIKKKYHDWVYMADDQINKVLKTLIISVYGYGAYIFIAEMWSKYI